MAKEKNIPGLSGDELTEDILKTRCHVDCCMLGAAIGGGRFRIYSRYHQVGT
jgi:hypothetical protein